MSSDLRCMSRRLVDSSACVRVGADAEVHVGLADGGPLHQLLPRVFERADGDVHPSGNTEYESCEAGPTPTRNDQSESTHGAIAADGARSAYRYGDTDGVPSLDRSLMRSAPTRPPPAARYARAPSDAS